MKIILITGFIFLCFMVFKALFNVPKTYKKAGDYYGFEKVVAGWIMKIWKR